MRYFFSSEVSQVYHNIYHFMIIIITPIILYINCRADTERRRNNGERAVGILSERINLFFIISELLKKLWLILELVISVPTLYYCYIIINVQQRLAIIFRTRQIRFKPGARDDKRTKKISSDTQYESIQGKNSICVFLYRNLLYFMVKYLYKSVAAEGPN